MGKQIQIVGMNAPFEEKALDLETGNQFTFAKPAEGDAVKIGDLNFIRAIKNIDTFRGWTVNYKRSEDVVVVLKIDKIEKEAIDEDFNKFTFTFVNDDVDVSSIVLVKLVVEYNEKTGAIEAEYQDETKEIQAGTVLPTPSAEDNGRILGVDDGEYALVNNPVPAVETTDKDKYLHTNSETGALEWSEVSGGSSLVIEIGDITSKSDLLALDDDKIYHGIIKTTEFGMGLYYKKGLIYGVNTRGSHTTLYGFRILELSTDSLPFIVSVCSDESGQESFEITTTNNIPLLPHDASTKTYVLKSVNGTVSWVEENAQ